VNLDGATEFRPAEATVQTRCNKCLVDLLAAFSECTSSFDGLVGGHGEVEGEERVNLPEGLFSRRIQSVLRLTPHWILVARSM